MRVHGTTVGEIVVHSLHEIHKTTVRDRLCDKKKNDNNIGEKDYVILYLSGQIPRKTALRRLR